MLKFTGIGCFIWQRLMNLMQQHAADVFVAARDLQYQMHVPAVHIPEGRGFTM